MRRAGRADRGRHRLPDELLQVTEGMALRRPPPHAAEVYRASVKIAAEQGWKSPSYTVVREVIAGLDRGLLALALKNEYDPTNLFRLNQNIPPSV